MAHYALIDVNNIVVDVITGIDENLTQVDEQGIEVGGSTEAWESFYSSLPWFQELSCKRTSYNGKIRKNFAGIGFIYDPNRDAFIAPKCHEIANLNEDTCRWECNDEAHTPTV